MPAFAARELQYGRDPLCGNDIFVPHLLSFVGMWTNPIDAELVDRDIGFVNVDLHIVEAPARFAEELSSGCGELQQAIAAVDS